MNVILGFLGLLSWLGFSLGGTECLGFDVYATVHLLSLAPAAVACLVSITSVFRISF